MNPRALPQEGPIAQRPRLRAKLMLLVMLTCAVALLVQMTALAAYEHFRVLDDIGRDLAALARVLANRSAAALEFNDEAVGTEMLSALQAKPEISEAALYDTGGRVLARYRRSGSGPSLLPDHPASQADARRQGNDYVVLQPVEQDGAALGLVYVRASLAGPWALWWRYLAVAGAITVLSALVAWLFGKRWQATVLLPLERLTETVKRIAGSRNYTLRAQAESGDETATLVECFNDMLQVIQQAHEALELRVAERTRDLQAANDRVRRREASFRAIFDQAAVGMSSIGADMQRHRVNRAFADFLGYPAGELLHRRAMDDLAPEELAAVAQERDALLSGHKVQFRRDTCFVHRDGSRRWADMQVTRVEEPDSGGFSLLATMLDITELRRTQLALESSYKLLGALLDTIPNPVFYKGADTRFLGCNRAYESAFGVRRADFIGRRVLDLEYLPMEDRQRYQAEDEAVIASIGRVTREQRIQVADGRELDTLYSVTGFAGPDGRPGGLIGLVVDITALKEAERRALHSQEQAEQASRMKSDFLATMSHEIRTPMNAIIGMLYLALESELPDTLRNWLGKAQTAAHSLLGIINDVLDFSKIEAGKLEIAHLEFAIDGVIEQVKDALGLAAEHKGVEFLVRYDSSLPRALVGDPLRVGQILINLCSNAIKFTERGEVELALRRLPDLDDGVSLQFTVRDTGSGIAPELAARLFQKFSQADQTATRRHGGTGLGLAISRQLAELMGGTVWLERSEPGQGSTFCCRLRLGTAPETVATSAPARRSGDLLAGLRILVVDDNESAREIACDMLRGFGVAVESATSGASALETLRAPGHAPFDLVLMDWHMPPMNGDEVARRIQASPGIDPKPKVLMVTAYGHEEVARAARAVAAAGLLLKPVSPSSLLDAVLLALGRGRVLDPPRRAPGAASVADLGGARLLLVEDNEVNLEFATELLGRMHARVDTARSGQEALEMVQENDYAAVLMDIHMPIMDGLEATRRIRALGRGAGGERLARLPIIAMTALAMANDEHRSRAAGMNDHLTKPIDPERLRAVLYRWLGIAAPASGATTPAGDEGPAQPLPAELLALTQVDAQAGVARIGGNAEAYRAQLLRFARHHRDADERLGAQLALERTEEAGELCHALKGVCGNLCASGLYATVGELDDGLRRGIRPSDATLARFGQQLRQLVGEIDQLERAAIATTRGVKMDSGRIGALANQLVELLGSDLGAVRPVLQTLQAGTAGTDLAELVADIAERIDSFDIDQAVTQLQALSAGSGRHA